MDGCENLVNLNATPKDIVFVERMARGYGVLEENIFRTEEATEVKQLNQSFITIKKRSIELTAAKTPHVLMVYCGGHGATKGER